MKCYNCGSTLTNETFCPGCGADVRVYKKCIRLSNTFYNMGLEKARVRDLTGAVESLKLSLACNRNNIPARNLLGLVYYEMGELVPALAEWVISTSFSPNKNIAEGFLTEVQNNPARLDNYKQTIRKYNQALSYAGNGDLDLAVIQLKKVVSMNPGLISGHLLLGLLYLNNGQWNRAKRTLEKALRIDHNNTQALTYLKEAEERIAEKEAASGKKHRQKEEAIVYQSGNETIIQPLNGAETAGRWTVLNILIGLALGMAVMWFLILPSRIQAAKSEISLQLREVSEELTEKTADIEELNRQIETLNGEREHAREELGAFTGEDGILQDYNNLLQAARSYVEDPEDALAAASYLEQVRTVSADQVSGEFQELYTILDSNVSGKASEQLKESGLGKYDGGNYEGAAMDLSTAFDLNQKDDEILYYLADSYAKAGDTDKATELFHQLLDSFEDSSFRDEAEEFLDREGGEEETDNGNSTSRSSGSSSSRSSAAGGTGTASNEAGAAETGTAEAGAAETGTVETPSVPEAAADGADAAAAALEAAVGAGAAQ